MHRLPVFVESDFHHGSRIRALRSLFAHPTDVCGDRLHGHLAFWSASSPHSVSHPLSGHLVSDHLQAVHFCAESRRCHAAGIAAARGARRLEGVRRLVRQVSWRWRLCSSRSTSAIRRARPRLSSPRCAPADHDRSVRAGRAGRGASHVRSAAVAEQRARPARIVSRRDISGLVCRQRHGRPDWMRVHMTYQGMFTVQGESVTSAAQIVLYYHRAGTAVIAAACTTEPRDCAQIEPLLASAERSLRARFAATDLDGVLPASQQCSVETLGTAESPGRFPRARLRLLARHSADADPRRCGRHDPIADCGTRRAGVDRSPVPFPGSPVPPVSSAPRSSSPATAPRASAIQFPDVQPLRRVRPPATGDPRLCRLPDACRRAAVARATHGRRADEGRPRQRAARARSEPADRRGIHAEDQGVHDRDVLPVAARRLPAGVEDRADAEGHPRRHRRRGGQAAVHQRGPRLHAAAREVDAAREGLLDRHHRRRARDDRGRGRLRSADGEAR